MGSFDTITWQALTALLTLGCLVAAVVAWRWRGPVPGLRWLALALLPPAAYLTGTLRLAWEVGDAVASWAVRLALTPAVWLGAGLALLSLVLFTVAGALAKRRDRRAGRPRSTPVGPRAPTAGQVEAGPVRSGADDDLDDVEEILRRRGIT